MTTYTKIKTAPSPVVVMWGGAQRELPEDASRDGIEFVGGRRLLTWLGTLDGQPIDKDAATDLIRRLEKFRSTSWDSTIESKR